MIRKKTPPRVISQEQWQNLKSETFNTILAILESLEIFSGHMTHPSYGRDTSPIICTALYTHAIEEYGKFIYLQAHIPIKGQIKLDHDGKFKNHNFKFKLGLKNLPKKCKVVYEGSYSSKSHTTRSHTVDTIPNWHLRLDILNTDLDLNGIVKPYPKIDKTKLTTAISEFKTEMFGLKVV